MSKKAWNQIVSWSPYIICLGIGILIGTISESPKHVYTLNVNNPVVNRSIDKVPYGGNGARYDYEYTNSDLIDILESDLELIREKFVDSNSDIPVYKLKLEIY